jgi:23S rRNA (guanosine2251-2'-O)-methyltransferase
MSKKDQWVSGINAVASALEHDVEHVREVLLEAGAKNPRITEIEETARRRDVPVRRVALQALEGIAGGLRHQGAIARYEAAKPTEEKELPGLVEAAAGKALLLVLDGVQDPHNLGACLRVADAAAAHAVIAPKDKAVGLNATAVKVASGAADTVPYVTVTNLARALRELQEAGIWVLGAAGEADKTIYDIDQKVPTAWVLGAEGSGLRRLTRDTCDALARIPMLGSVESLNVSVASGICLFEARRQRAGSAG